MTRTPTILTEEQHRRAEKKAWSRGEYYPSPYPIDDYWHVKLPREIDPRRDAGGMIRKVGYHYDDC
jgi:hypothetical protein